MKKKVTKHLSYYDVIEALDKEGCPVCNLTKKGIEDYYDSLIYEYINDMNFRDTFRLDKGFCQYHAHKFLTYNDGLAVALPYRDLLFDTLKDLKKPNHNKKSKNELQNDKCMICRREEDLQKTYIDIIIDYIEDEEFVSAFTKSDGLCVAHYKMTLSMMKYPPRWFVDFHIERYEKILNDLDRYIDSCNYSLGDKRPVLTRREKLIWKKVVKYIHKDR